MHEGARGGGGGKLRQGEGGRVIVHTGAGETVQSSVEKKKVGHDLSLACLHHHLKDECAARSQINCIPFFLSKHLISFAGCDQQTNE